MTRLEQIVADLAIKLDQMGHEVHVVGPAESTIGQIGNIQLIDGGPKQPNAHAWEEAALEKQIKPRLDSGEFKDAIWHDHCWRKPIYKAKMANPNLHVIATLHGMVPYHQPPPVQNPCMVGLSKSHAQSISSALGIKVRHCYNGIDLSKYNYNGQNRTDRYLFLGRINSYKAPHAFIDLLEQAKVPGDVVGDDILVEDPSYVERVLGMCNQLQGQVKYWGGVHRERAVEFFQHAKALVCPLLPPWSEPFNLTVVESMACGTPVIGTANGALPELIEHGKTGYVAPFYQDLAPYMSDQMVNQIKPEDCRERAKQFSREAMAINYLKLYEQVQEGGW